MLVPTSNAAELPEPQGGAEFPWLEQWQHELKEHLPLAAGDQLWVAESFAEGLLRFRFGWGTTHAPGDWLMVNALTPPVFRWPLALADGVWGWLAFQRDGGTAELPPKVCDLVAAMVASFEPPDGFQRGADSAAGRFVTPDDWLNFFSEGGRLPLAAGRLLEAVPAAGLSVLWQGNVYTLGRTPPVETVKAFAAEAAGQTVRLEASLTGLERFGGYAWLALHADQPDGLLWWRARLPGAPRWAEAPRPERPAPQSEPWLARDQAMLLRLRGDFLDLLQLVAERQKSHFFEAGRQMFTELQQLSLVASKTSGGVLIADSGWKILWANDSLRSILGFTPMTLVGQQPDWLFQGLFGALTEEGLGSLTGGQSLRRECQVTSALGDPRWVHVEVTPVRQASEQVTEYIVILTDIHERRLAQQEVQRQTLQLEETVDELREALERSRRLESEATAAARAKTTFLATMSHEIRTPLNGIIGMAALMQGSEVSDEQHEYLETIQGCGRNLADLINNILDFTKLDAGAVQLRHETYDLEECIFTAFQAVEPAVHDKGLTLDLVLPDELPPMLMGDEVRLRQVFLNLLSNAVKFTDAGRVTFRVMITPLLEHLVELTVEVEDSGCGIPPEAQGELFDAFRQVDGGLNRKHEGTGLGLAICKAIVQAMGGNLSVESTVGAGSTFTVRWQALCDEAVDGLSPEIMPEPAPGPQRPARVLVVEDNAVNTTVARKLLEREGHVVETASDGAVALRMSAARAYDLVLLDLSLPGRDGFSIAEEMRAQRGDLTPPLAALTAHTGDSFRQRAEEAGMCAFLTKPVQPDDLRRLLSQVLSFEAENAAGAGTEKKGNPFRLGTEVVGPFSEVVG